MNYFTKSEIALWSCSSIVIILTFFVFDRVNYLTLAASLIGVTSLVFNAKGNPFGQLLMVIFSFLYGVISYGFTYYGEMVTYLGMTMPMAVFSLVSWLKNPYKGNKAEVMVNYLNKKEIIFMCLLSIIVTIIFYFVLDYFHTASLILSTISITTSFIAIYLTFKRSSCFALAYALNDIILIILWIIASIENIKYLSVVACFIAFLVNDIYGFINWRRMGIRQAKNI